MRNCGDRVTANMTPAKISGVRMAMSDRGTLPWPVFGGAGEAMSGGGGGGAGRGGRLNGIVPAALAWRTGSTAMGRSPSSTGRSSSSSAPSRTGTPSSSGTGLTTGSPPSHVPLCDPRSATVTSPAMPTASCAWRFETVGWSSSTSQPDARPSTMVPGISGNRRPASSPLTTTNSDEPAAVTGVRAAPTAACSGRVIATARPRRTVAPSWRPASPSSKSGSAGRSPISSVRSSPAVGSRARTRSATVAEGLLTRTSSSRRASPAT